MLTPERIAEIEARVNAATEGPWFLEYDDKDDKKDYYRIESQAGDYVIGCDGANSDDSDFIISARQDIPDLLAEVKRLQSEIAQLSSKTLQLEADNQKLREVVSLFADAWALGLEDFNSDLGSRDIDKTRQEFAFDRLNVFAFERAAEVLAETEAK